jgi:ketosteroid isomerase-like protein
VSVEEYVADVERGRAGLAEFLAERGRTLRFFRFPMLHEGDTPAKLDAMRDYLERSGQRNLPVTLDNSDYDFAEPWVLALRAGDEQRKRDVTDEFQAALRLSIRRQERLGDELFGRPVPQVLLLHAAAVGTAQWDPLFDWLERSGHRFADADTVLADPAFASPHAFVGPKGYGLWDRIAVERQVAAARAEVDGLLQTQAGAWSAGELDAFCSVYTDDAVFVTPDGMRKGRQQILERYRKRYVDRAAMGTLTLEILEFHAAHGVERSLVGTSRPSRVHGASLVARWTLSYPDREAATGLTLIVLERGARGWRIVQDASM